MATVEEEFEVYEYFEEEVVITKPSKPSVINVKPVKPKIEDIKELKQVSKYMRDPPGLDLYSQAPNTVLLVYGYIREAFEPMSRHHIIPADINILCYNFYRHKLRNLFISIGWKIRSIHIEFTSPTTNIQHEINTKSQCLPCPSWFSSSSISGELKGASFCKATNMEIPQQIFKQITDKEPNDFDVIFRCGGSEGKGWYSSRRDIKENNYCQALIVTDAGSKIYEWSLPKLPQPLQGGYSLFDDKYGLLYIGGIGSEVNNEIYNLSFKGNQFSDVYRWNWDSVTSLCDEVPFTNFAAVMINSGVNTDTYKLIICGGDVDKQKSKKVNMYDMNSAKWTELEEMRFGREKPGIYWARHQQRIFIGSDSKIEYYDIFKGKWMTLATTWNMYTHYPNIWMENENLVYISSNSLHAIECVDLRMDLAKNVVVCSASNDSNLSVYSQQSLDMRMLRLY